MYYTTYSIYKYEVDYEIEEDDMGQGKAPPGTQSRPPGGSIAGLGNAGAQVTSGSPKSVKAGLERPGSEKRT